jgi:hypothetical protein
MQPLKDLSFHQGKPHGLEELGRLMQGDLVSLHLFQGVMVQQSPLIHLSFTGHLQTIAAEEGVDLL